jgi:hypothetical protein
MYNKEIEHKHKTYKIRFGLILNRSNLQKTAIFSVFFAGTTKKQTEYDFLPSEALGRFDEGHCDKRG